MRESKIEKVVTEFAKDLGWLSEKFNVARDSPDRIYLRKGEVVFIEFKATGKKARVGQLRYMMKLIDQGFTCCTCDDIEQGKEIFRILDVET